MGGVDVCPDVDDRGDLLRRHVGKRDVVLLGKGEDVAFACGGLGTEKRRCEVWSRKSHVSLATHEPGLLTIAFIFRLVLGLVFLDGAVVVDEDQGVLVIRIGVTGRASVAGAKVALEDVRSKSPGLDSATTYLGIVLGKFSDGRSLFLTSEHLSSCSGAQLLLGAFLLPGSLSPVGRNQQPGALEWVIPAVGDVVENLVRHRDGFLLFPSM